MAISGWYADAKMLSDSFKIQGYPSFLFFTPDGQLIHRDIGYKNADEMIAPAKFALEPARLAYRVEMDKYARGVRDHPVSEQEILARDHLKFGRLFFADFFAG